jgi:regulator of nucleoside diphosphate kinase
MHHNKITITQPDLLRLAHLLRAHVRTSPYLAALERQLAIASLAPEAAVPPDVVTMGSRFRFTDRRSGVSETYRLVYPDEADLDRGRLSVFAPVGTAVLGRRAGETVWWTVPSGLRVVRIDEVLYQPERDHARRGDTVDAPDDSVEQADDDDAPSSRLVRQPFQARLPRRSRRTPRVQELRTHPLSRRRRRLVTRPNLP